MPASYNTRIFFSQIMIASITLILGSIVLWSVPLAILFSPDNMIQWGLIVLLTPVLLLGFHYRQSLDVGWRAGIIGILLAVVLAYGLNGVRLMRWNVIHPPEWDFQLFWLFGRVAVQGLNPYEPEHLRHLAQVLNPTDNLLAELYFFHSPPTLFLFAPLGWFDIHTAYLVWYLGHSVILILDIVLLWKIFQSDSGLLGLALTAALVLMLRATLSTIAFGQVNFLVLLLLLLFWRDREHKQGGIWLALGIIVKPVLVFLLIYLLLRRHWRVVASTFVTLATLSILTIIVFGPVMFFSYFFANPIVYDMPDYLYTEPVNQSLLATILRVTRYDFSHTSPLFQPIFIFLTLILTGITGWLVFRLNMTHADWALALMLSFALLIFPKTLAHYSVLLIVPLLLLWMRRQELWGGVWGITAFITLIYMLESYKSGNYVFVAILLTWLILAGISVWVLIQKSKQPAASLQLVSTN